MSFQPVTKQQWIDALRSGEFNQCTGALGKINPETHTMSYCCLGVLATIAGVGHRLVPTPDGTTIFGTTIFDFDDEVSAGNFIPKAFRNTIVSDLDLTQSVLGLKLHDDLDDLIHTLSSKNDRGASFNEIADYLETVQ